jgi:hypothetical protein
MSSRSLAGRPCSRESLELARFFNVDRMIVRPLTLACAFAMRSASSGALTGR